MLYLSTWLAPLVTDVLHMANFDVGAEGVVSFVTSGIWPVGLFAIIAQKIGLIGFLLLGAIVLGGLVYKNKIAKPGSSTTIETN